MQSREQPVIEIEVNGCPVILHFASKGNTIKLKFAHLYGNVFLPIIKVVMDRHNEKMYLDKRI